MAAAAQRACVQRTGSKRRASPARTRDDVVAACFSAPQCDATAQLFTAAAQLESRLLGQIQRRMQTMDDYTTLIRLK